MNSLKTSITVLLFSFSLLFVMATAQEVNPAPEVPPPVTEKDSSNNDSTVSNVALEAPKEEKTPEIDAHPPVVSGIPEESILEGGSFTPIKLDQFVQDEIDKPSAIVWTVKGNKDLKVSISNRVATIQTPDKYWNGIENITFISTHSNKTPSSGTAGFQVASANNPPEIKQIPNQTIAEKKKFSPIKLDDYVSDPDHEKKQIVWETYVEPTNKKQAEGDLSVEIDKNRIASVLTPDSYWYGEAKITFTATDGEFASDKTTAIFTVTPVNDPPVVKKHPDQVIQEKEYFESIYLDELVTDVDNETSEIKWTVSGGKDLKASIDKHNVATIKAPYEHWNGPAETFTFTATDPEGASASFNTTFTVKSINDPPEFLSNIEDQSIDEKKEFKAIQLDKLVKDIDHSFEQLKWSVSGNKDLKVEFSGKEAKVLIPNPLWNGYETILFKVTDPEGASAESEASFTVHSINDPPVFVKAIPDQSIDEKKTFSTIQLDEFIKDPDHKNQDLSFDVEVKHKGKEPESGTLEVEISEKRVASIKIPNKLWNGSAVATFTVTDPEGATVKQSVNFTVKSINDLPEIKKIPDQNINEKESLASISLEEYLSDPDHEISQLKVELSGLKEIKANLNNATKEVSFQLPYNHWNGTETLTIKVTDPEGGTASTNVKLSVKSINDPPVMKDIANQTIKEKGTFKPIALDQFVSDLDHTNNQLKWTIEGNKDLKAVIDAKKNLMVSTPNPYWNGAETIKLTVTDPEGAKDSRSVTFTVQSVNDKPEFVRAIPNQNIAEKKEFQAIQLDDFIKDPDHKKEELKWTYKAVVASDAPAVRGRKPTPPQDSELKVNIDKNRVATIQIPNKYWNGMADITFTATDPEGASASSTMRANVRSINDPPVFVKPIADQSIDEKKDFAKFNLSELLNDPDHSFAQIKWTVTGNKDLKVNILKSGETTVSIPNKLWNGTEKITFVATDPEGASARQTVSFNVKSINDPPVMKDIANQTIKEKGTFKPIALDQFVSDLDHTNNQLKWTIEGNKDLRAVIDAKKNLMVSTPNPYWNGAETIKLTVTDPEGAKDSRSVTFTVQSVNDKPEFVRAIPNQNIDEKKEFQAIQLDDFIKDPDHKKEELKWTYKAVVASDAPAVRGRKPTPPQDSELKVQIDRNRVATIQIPNKYWNGMADITFTATDPEGASASSTMRANVRSINDPPVFVKPIADQSIDEKKDFAKFNLSELLNDPDHSFAQIKWTVTGNKDLKVNILKSGETTVSTPNKLWNGTEKITFVATDPEGASARQTVSFNVKSINDPPVMKDIANQTIKEKGSFKPIALDQFVSDLDHTNNQLKWTIEGNKDLRAVIDAKKNLMVSTPNPYWNGAETIKLTVTDPEGAKDSRSVTFTVQSVNDKPEFVRAIPNQNIDEKKEFQAIQLDDFIKDPDHKKEELKWTYKAVVANDAPAVRGRKPTPPQDSELKVNIDKNRVATIQIPNKYWNGMADITFTATDPEGASASSTMRANVRSINDPPVFVKPIADQSIDEKKDFAKFNLSELLNDPDHSFAQIKWTVTGNKDLKVNILKSGETTVSTPNKLWNGTEKITFVATDPEGASARQTVSFNVKSINDPPVMKDIANQTIKEKGSFKPIALDQFVSDLDHTNNQLKWTIEGNKDLRAVIDAKKNLMVSTPNPYWNGAETIKLTVTDPEGAKDSRSVTFTVQSVNDKPEFVRAIPNQNIAEKKEFQAIQLDDFIKDPDHKKEELKWTYKAVVASDAPAVRGRKPTPPQDSELKVNIDKNRVATIQIPNKYWNGMADITFTATDPEGASASSTMRANVRSINDPPVFVKPIADQSIDEKKDFAKFNLSELLNDPDHSFAQIKWTVTGNKDLKVIILKRGETTVSIPNKMWNDTVYITFMDS